LLGKMSNIFNFILKGEANGDESPSNISDEGQAPKAQAPQLTKEQLRERRLGKLGGSGPAADAPEIQQKGTEKEQASLKMDIPPSSPTKVAAANGSSNNNNSSTSSSSTPATPIAAGGSGTTTPIAQKPSPLTSPKGANGANTPSNNERVLNMALEGVFLFSLRPASSVSMSIQQGGGMSGPQVKFMGDENSPTRLLNSVNLTEALLERLSDTQDGVGSSVNYLVGSYKRILQKEGALKDATRTEFLGCKSQCVNFIVTALTEPDTFSPNSDNSMSDLVQLLKDDTSPHISPFLKDLAEELERQGSLSEVVEGIVSSCFDGMNGGSSSSSDQESLMESMARMTGQPAPPKMRSILDASTSGPVGVVRALCLADKRLAKAVSEQSCFQLEPSLATAKPGRPTRQPAQNMQHMFGFAMPPANQQSSSGPSIVQGAAVADTTLLGRMLRNVVDSRDPAFRQMFENVHLGVPRNVLEGNFARLRGPLNSAQIAVNDALLSMLKAGSAKEVALTWIQQAIVCNAENSKDEPDLRIGASRGFLLQLSGVLLRLCRPFLHDADKILSKVDWRYLVQPENASVFSREETGLFTRVVAPQHPPSNPAPAGTNAFMTQTMFHTARCLHLSLSPMIRRMKNCARHVHHLREELQNSDPRAINVLMQLMVYQTELLNEDLLSMTVDYCGALATLLLGALNGSSSSSSSSSSIGSASDEESGSTDTILGKEQFTVQQKEVLSALPEYVFCCSCSSFLFLL
jgi:ubiquitin conjugation factor E4 B